MRTLYSADTPFYDNYASYYYYMFRIEKRESDGNNIY